MTVAAATSSTAATTSSTASSIASGQSQLNETYTSFLTLLTAQLKNQDPLSPMDTNTFTQQLVSMNGVQQQLLGNNLLQQLVTQSTGAGSVGRAINMIGKSVTSQTAVAALQNGSADWSYNLGSAASKATLEVLDANGNVVWSGAAPDLGAGDHAFSWNGATNLGATAPDADYTLAVSANDASGAAITSTVSITGTVTGVQANNGVTQVTIGSLPVDFTTVTSIKNPS